MPRDEGLDDLSSAGAQFATPRNRTLRAPAPTFRRPRMTTIATLAARHLSAAFTGHLLRS
jgi:hypothetical protein